MKLGHIISARQFDLKTLNEIFRTASAMEVVFKQGGNNLLSGRRMISLFYEPSTRTRASFEMAMDYLGGKVVFSTENARQFSSAAKGETLEDTIRVLSSYGPDVIVLRYDEIGGAERAAEVIPVPIINAGDGAGEHPTQALLDLYTIKKEFGEIEGISIAMVGDLKNGRTIHSLCYLLTLYPGVTIYFVAPPVVRIGEEIKDYLRRFEVQFFEETDFLSVVQRVDVIYQTRIQKERFESEEEYQKACGLYVIDRKILDLLAERSIIMHPLPRVGEISREVDEDKRAVYFDQAQNGLLVRMALLSMILE